MKSRRGRLTLLMLGPYPPFSQDPRVDLFLLGSQGIKGTWASWDPWALRDPWASWDLVEPIAVPRNPWGDSWTPMGFGGPSGFQATESFTWCRISVAGLDYRMAVLR